MGKEIVELIGFVRYETPNGITKKNKYKLGYMNSFIASCCLDLDISEFILKRKYEKFLSKKEDKDKYKLIDINLRICKSKDKFKDYTLYKNIATLCKGY